MDIREAITHARQVAEGCEAGNRDCAYQHDKLADWLEELLKYRGLGSVDYLRGLAEAEKAKRLIVLPEVDGADLYGFRAKDIAEELDKALSSKCPDDISDIRYSMERVLERLKQLEAAGKGGSENEH